MSGKRGRPMKYEHFLRALKDDEAYCPSSIVRHGLELGLFPKQLTQEELKVAKLRVRITMGRLSHNHDFPIGGDDLVFIDGQAPIPGWFGARWKATLED